MTGRARAKVTASTRVTPAARKASAASARVAPVVNTSSTRTTESGSRVAGTAKAPATLARRSSGVSAVWLEGPAREAVHHLKYAGWWRVTEVMAEAMRGLEPLANSGVLVPIPLTQKRLRTRGYNQSERLARALADRRTAGPPVRIDLLRRGRETPTQTALTPEERRANVAGAFTVHASRLPDTVVLVDDVFTTGATLAEAAGACLAAGVKQVEAVTFARARPVIPS